MSSLITSIWNRLCSKQAPQTIMIIGLDNSGKTSILERLKSSSPGQRKTSSSSQSSPKRPHSMSETIAFDEPEALLNLHDDEPLVIQVGENASGSARTSSESSGSSWSPGHEENISPTIGYNYSRVRIRGQTVNVLDFSGQSRYRELWSEFYNCVDAIVFVIDSSDFIRLVVARDELETLLNHPYFNSLQRATRDGESAVHMGGSSNSGTTTTTSKLAFQMEQKQLLISQGKLVQSPLEYPNSNASKSHTTKQEDDLVPQRTEINAGRGRRRTRIPILFLANKTDLTNSADDELIAKTLNLSQVPLNRHPWQIQATSVNTNHGIQQGFDWLLGELFSLST